MPVSSQKQLLDQLVAARRLTEDEAKRVLRAPRVTVPSRLVLVSVAVVILSIGLVRLGVALVDEAPDVLLVVLLYAVAVVAAMVAWRWARREGWRRSAGEFTELLSLGSAIGATAMLMVNADLDGQWLALSLGGAAAVWGLVRLGTSLYAGVVALVPGAIAVTGGLTAWLDLQESWSAVPFVVMGGLLVLRGQGEFALAALVRMAGVVMVVAASPALLSFHHDLWATLAALAVGLTLIGAGQAWSRLEQVVGGSIVVVATVVRYAFRHIDNEILQGVVVTAIGATGLAFVVSTFRHRPSKRGQPLAEQG